MGADSSPCCSSSDPKWIFFFFKESEAKCQFSTDSKMLGRNGKCSSSCRTTLQIQIVLFLSVTTSGCDSTGSTMQDILKTYHRVSPWGICPLLSSVLQGSPLTEGLTFGKSSFWETESKTKQCTLYLTIKCKTLQVMVPALPSYPSRTNDLNDWATSTWSFTH